MTPFLSFLTAEKNVGSLENFFIALSLGSVISSQSQYVLNG